MGGLDVVAELVEETDVEGHGIAGCPFGMEAGAEAEIVVFAAAGFGAGLEGNAVEGFLAEAEVATEGPGRGVRGRLDGGRRGGGGFDRAAGGNGRTDWRKKEQRGCGNKQGGGGRGADS